MMRYAITDRMLLGGDEAARRRGLVEQAARLARAGVDYLQIREKDLPAGELVQLARAIVAVVERGGSAGQRRTRVLINSRADVAMAAGADGVHLTSAEGELTARQVRGLYAAAGLGGPVVSVSCHGLEDVARVCGAGGGAGAEGGIDGRPDVILFGPVFEKRVRGELVAEGSGLELLARAVRLAAPTPVFALGGVTEQNSAQVLAAGAAGVAGIRLFLAASGDC